MDTTKLLKALDNDSNEQILNFTTKKIMETNLSILKELHLSNKDTLEKNLDVALPLNKDTHNLPVIDETVYIRKVDGVLYYTRANYQNSPNFD